MSVRKRWAEIRRREDMSERIRRAEYERKKESERLKTMIKALEEAKKEESKVELDEDLFEI